MIEIKIQIQTRIFNNNSKNNFRQLKNPLENIQAIRAKELHNKINMEKKAQRRLGTPI